MIPTNRGSPGWCLYLPLWHQYRWDGGCGGGTEHAAKLGNVVVSRHYAYMCSDPGQALIKDDIVNEGLDRVVVASCSPLMHETTFRRACAKQG